MTFTIRHTIDINRPIQQVFDFHANLKNHVAWHDHILSVDCISDVKQGYGATFRVVNAVGWMKNTDIREIIAFDAPHTYTYQLTTATIIGSSQQILKPTATGTQFTVIGRFQTRGLARLLEPLITRPLDRHMGSALVELRHYLETVDLTHC